jgi:hypothetical protein
MDDQGMSGGMMVPVMPSGDGMMVLSVTKVPEAQIENNDVAATPSGSC